MMRLGLEELLGLGEADADEAVGDGNAGGDPENCIPRLDAATKAGVNARGEQAVKRLSLLEDTVYETAGAGAECVRVLVGIYL